MISIISIANLYFAYLIHQFFVKLSSIANGKLPDKRIDFSLIKAIKIYSTDNRVYLWLLILEAVLLIGILLVLLKPSYKITGVREYEVTDNIKIPIPAGNGQHGNTWFASEKDKKRLLTEISISSIDSKKEFSGDIGIPIEFSKTGDSNKIKYFKEFTHSMLVALTGAGKTRRIILESICMQIMFGKCILNTDIKGELFYYTSDFAKSHGYKVIVVDLNNPQKSNCYNFLQPVLDALEEGNREYNSKIEGFNKNKKIRQEEIKSKLELDIESENIFNSLKNVFRLEELEENLNDKDYSWTGKAQECAWDIVSALVGEPKGEPLWTNGEAATLCAAILAICIDAPNEYRNFYNLYMFLSYMTQTDPLINKRYLDMYIEELPDNHPAKIVFMQSQVAARRTRDSFYTSALATLRLFTIPALAQMSATSDFGLSDIGVKDKTIVYLITPDEKKTYNSIASLFINQLYVTLVESARKCGGTLPIEVIINGDEIGNYPLIPSLPSIATAGRSRGVVLNMVLQDYEQLKKIYKEDTETIKSQCGLKILLKSDSGDTLEDMSKKIGEYTVETVSASTSASTSSRTMDSNISNSSNLTGRRLLKTEELAKLKSPHALIMITGESPMITNLPDLSEYHFNKFLGLGDKEHNKKRIFDIENKRPERELEQVKMWGIWNVYKKKAEKIYIEAMKKKQKEKEKKEQSK